MNNIQLIGRLTRDAKLNAGKTSYCKFALAINRQFQKDEVDFIECIAFGKTAEILCKFTKKGDRIGASGRLQMSRYETKTGEKRTSYDVVCDNIYLLEPKNNNSNDNNNNSNNSNDEEFPF